MVTKLRLKAIVIDDDPPCRDLLSHILGSKGYEVACFADTKFCQVGNSLATSCLRTTPCGDFLLTDNRMPEVTGLQLLEFQQKAGCKIHSANKAILSGGWSPHDLAKAKAFGCKIFHKPYKAKEIWAWLEHERTKHCAGRGPAQ